MIFKLAIGIIAITRVVTCESAYSVSGNTEVQVISLEADFQAPILTGGDLPPDTTYDVYKNIWNYNKTQIESLRDDSIYYFKNITGIDLFSMPLCSVAKERPSLPLFNIYTPGQPTPQIPKFPSQSKFSSIISNPNNTFCLKSTFDAVLFVYDEDTGKNVLSFYHVKVPEFVGYKIVQTMNNTHYATECPLRTFDTAFTFNVLDDNAFECSNIKGGCKNGDSFAYGWYTIWDLKKDKTWDKIHYYSTKPISKRYNFVPLTFNAYSDTWGKGYTDGIISKFANIDEYTKPCFIDKCPYRLPKLFDTFIIQFRTVVRFFSS